MKTRYATTQRNTRYESTYINPYLKSSYTQQQPKEVKPATPQATSNGIKSWNVGDKLIHETFGVGVVRKIISDKLIEVEFEDKAYGIKTLLGTHIKIKKLFN